MTETNFRFFEFGEFRLDAHRRILQKNGVTIHLTPRSFDLLRVMVENAGRVLEHDELLDKVWAGTFVEQGNLKKTISALRNALGDAPGASEFITTVPRRGYRFTAQVRPLPDDTILIRETRTEITVEEEIEDQIAAPAPLQIISEDKVTRPYPTVRIAFAGIAILALTTIAFAAWMFWSKPASRFSVENVQISRLMSENNITSGMLSADGNFFVYSVTDGTQRSLWVRQVPTGSAVQIVPPMNASFWYISFTPDTNYVYYACNNRAEPEKSGIYRVPVLGGFSPQLIVNKIYLGLKFSPDGKRLAAFRTIIEDSKEKQELLTMNADGSDEQVILALPHYSLFRGIAWSPDGTSLLYGVKKQAFNDKQTHYIAEISADGGAENILMPEQEKIFYVEEWLPDKSSFFFRQREKNSEIYQIWQYFPASGEKSRVTNDDYSYTNLTVSRDGKTVSAFRSFAITSIWQKENDRTDFRQIASGPNSYFNLDWTADERLVFSATENAREFVGIMNIDGSQKRLLTNGTDGIRPHPSVSGDGKQIVFMSDRSDSRQAWRIDLDGRNLTQLTDAVGIGEAKLLADGQTIIYTAYLKTATWFLVKQTTDGRTITLNDTDTQEWDVSPDEKFLAIHTTDEKTKKNRLIVREMESGREIKSFDIENIWCLRWTRDGQALTFVRISDDMEEIILLPLDGAAERVLYSVRGERLTNFGWSPDGKRLALVRNKTQNEAVLIRTDNLR